MNKFNIEFEPTIEVAEPDRGFMFMLCGNTAKLTADNGKQYTVIFGKELTLNSHDSKVLVKIPLEAILDKMVEISDAVKRNKDTEGE